MLLITTYLSVIICSNMNLPIVCIVSKIDKVSDDLNFKHTIEN